MDELYERVIEIIKAMEDNKYINEQASTILIQDITEAYEDLKPTSKQ